MMGCMPEFFVRNNELLLRKLTFFTKSKVAYFSLHLSIDLSTKSFIQCSIQKTLSNCRAFVIAAQQLLDILFQFHFSYV